MKWKLSSYKIKQKIKLILNYSIKRIIKIIKNKKKKRKSKKKNYQKLKNLNHNRNLTKKITTLPPPFKIIRHKIKLICSTSPKLTHPHRHLNHKSTQSKKLNKLI
jgi:hypothetical protein